MLMSPEVALQTRQRAALPVAYWAVPVDFAYFGGPYHSRVSAHMALQTSQREAKSVTRVARVSLATARWDTMLPPSKQRACK